MDSFELNKIIGAFLGVVFVIFSVSILADSFFHTPAPETPGYAIVVPEEGAEGAVEEEETVESVLSLLADADPAAGENVFKRCQACHTPDQGGANKVGPNLWGVVGGPVTHREDFSYSSAMQEFAEGGTLWTYENLDQFLLDPKGLVPGTAMAFAGLRGIEDRANVIAYLRTLAEEPEPLPEPPAAEEESPEADEAAAAESEAQPAEGETSPETGAETSPDAMMEGDQEPAADEGTMEDGSTETPETDATTEPDAAADGEGDTEASAEEDPASTDQ